MAILQRLERFASISGLELSDIDQEQLPELTWDESDRIALSRNLGGTGSWLEGRVPAAHFLRAAERLREPLVAVIQRLNRFASILGLKLPDIDPDQLSDLSWNRSDLIALSQKLNGESPWIAGDVSSEHIQCTSWMLGESTSEIRKRLHRFVPFGISLPAE